MRKLAQATVHADPPLKRVARAAWRAGLDASVLGAARQPFGDAEPKVFYGGARSGDVGGPLVKVKRLAEHFPQARVGFNTVYTLSNAPYLSRRALERLKARGICLVHNQNGVFYAGWYGPGWEAQNRRMAEAYQLADHVFWQSEFCRRAAERFLGPHGGTGEVLFNAVDIGRFAPRTEPRTPGAFRFLTTGKYGGHQAYALEITLDALALAARDGLDAEVMFAGHIDADARRTATECAARLGLSDRLRFLGPYSQSGASAVYQAADAYITTRYMDNCPNSVIEAMACGLPIVHSATGGVPELVGTDAGVGLPLPEDWDSIHHPLAEDLAAAMHTVAAGHARMGEAARGRAEQCFDLRRWIARHREVFTQLLEARR